MRSLRPFHFGILLESALAIGCANVFSCVQSRRGCRYSRLLGLSLFALASSARTMSSSQPFSVDLLADSGVRTAEHGILFLPDGLRTPDDGMLCRVDGDLRTDSGILFPSHGILFPHSGVLTGDSVDLLTHIGVRTLNSGMRFLADGILCRVSVVLQVESVIRTRRYAGSG